MNSEKNKKRNGERTKFEQGIEYSKQGTKKRIGNRKRKKWKQRNENEYWEEIKIRNQETEDRNRKQEQEIGSREWKQKM